MSSLEEHRAAIMAEEDAMLALIKATVDVPIPAAIYQSVKQRIIEQLQAEADRLQAEEDGDPGDESDAR